MGFLGSIAGLLGFGQLELPAPPRQTVDVHYAASGTRISGGRVQGVEENPDLRGCPGRAAAVFQQNVMQDPHLAGLDRALRHTLLSATLVAEPASDKPEAVRNAELINRVFGWAGYPGTLDEPWERYLARMVHYPTVGFKPMEEVYRVIAGELVLAGFFDVDPSSVEAWVPGRDGELAFIQQRPWTLGEPDPLPIPAHKCVLFVQDQVGRNWSGVGLARSCWFAVKARRDLANLLLQGAGRWAMPIPRIKVDPRIDADGEQRIEDDALAGQITEMSSAAVELQSGGTSYVQSTADVTLDTYGEGSFKGSTEILSAITHFAREMSTAFLAKHMDLGGTDVTSARNVGEVHHAVWLAAAINHMDDITQTLGGQDRPGGGTVGRLLVANYYGEGARVPADEMPVIRHYGLEVSGLAQSMNLLPTLVTSGLLKPTETIRAAVLGLLGVAPEPESESVGDTETDEPDNLAGAARMPDVEAQDGEVNP